MPKSELHQRKKARNYAVMGALVVFMLTVFFVTIIRMKVGT